MDLKAMQREVADNLALAGLEQLPMADRVLRKLNRAKDNIVGQLELLDQNQFTYRKDYTVSVGTAYITLPTGSEASYPYCRRILGLHEVIGNDEVAVLICDRRDEGERNSRAGFWMHREGGLLYFQDGLGALRAMTLRLRYAGLPADLDGTDQDDVYDGIPDEWCDLLIMKATMDLLPAANANYIRYKADYDNMLAMLRSAWTNQVNAEAAHVREAW